MPDLKNLSKSWAINNLRIINYPKCPNNCVLFHDYLADAFTFTKYYCQSNYKSVYKLQDLYT